jgi:hypothetical protein
MNMKKGCSFRLEDWGIDRWPTLRVTIAGCQRRAEQTQAKRKKPSLGAKEKVAVQSDVIRRAAVTSPSNVIQEEGPALQIRTHFQGDSISAPLPITGTTIDSDVAPAPSPLPSPSPAMVATPAQHGTINSVFLYDILPYKTALSDPESSRYHLKAKGIEVRAIATREVSDARTLANFIECRAGILMDLADMLSDAASAAGDDDTEDAQDGNEDNGGAEVYNGQEEYTGDAGGRENEEVGTG